LKTQPTLTELLYIIPNYFPQLANKLLGIAYKVNDDFVLARTDNDIAEAFRSSGGKELNLYVTCSDNEDPLISSIETRLSQLSIISSEIQLIKQNYSRTIQEKLTEQEKRQNYYDEILQGLTTQSAGLETELQKIREQIGSLHQESTKYKESLKVLVSQYQSKLQEAAELKKERDEKVMLEAKLLQLQKELNDKNDETLTMSKRIVAISQERDIANKKSEELEVQQQNLESDFLTQSLKINSLQDPLANALPGSSTTNGSSLPFSVPSDIAEMDIQMLLFAGIKLDTPSEQQKVFEMLRQKKDISQIIEALL